jgi:chromate reductase
VPAPLKNAIDVGSRPYGPSVWSGKPGAVMSVSPGGFGANHHLRQSMVFPNVPTMQQPEAYVAGISGVFDETGELTSEGTQAFFTAFMEAYGAWIEVHVPHQPVSRVDARRGETAAGQLKAIRTRRPMCRGI